MRTTIKTVDDVGKAFGLQRANLGLSQSDMLLKGGFSQQQIQRIEAGANITVKTLLDIADALGLEVTIKEKELKIPSSPKSAKMVVVKQSNRPNVSSSVTAPRPVVRGVGHKKGSASFRGEYRKAKTSPAMRLYGHLLSKDNE